VSIPNWWEFLLLVLAAFRVWKLLAEDTILDRVRDASMLLAFKARGASGKQYWELFLTCPWCAGAWITLAWWGAWQAWEHTTLVVATPFALSAVVGLVGSFTTED
jgi:Protein of unknown function (DUF1360)